MIVLVSLIVLLRGFPCFHDFSHGASLHPQLNDFCTCNNMNVHVHTTYMCMYTLHTCTYYTHSIMFSVHDAIVPISLHVYRDNVTVLKCTFCLYIWNQFFIISVLSTVKTFCHGFLQTLLFVFCPSWIQVKYTCIHVHVYTCMYIHVCIYMYVYNYTMLPC